MIISISYLVEEFKKDLLVTLDLSSFKAMRKGLRAFKVTGVKLLERPIKVEQSLMVKHLMKTHQEWLETHYKAPTRLQQFFEKSIENSHLVAS